MERALCTTKYRAKCRTSFTLKITHMKKISPNGRTIIVKRIFPIAYYSFLTLLTLVTPEEQQRAVIIAAICAGIVGYIGMRFFPQNLIDEAYDDGDALLLKNKNKEVRVHFKDIKKVDYLNIGWGGPFVTLTLLSESALGQKISFIAGKHVTAFERDPEVSALIDRIERTVN